MANAIPQHIRENYERTDDALHEIAGLVYAVEMASEQIIDIRHDDLAFNMKASIAKDTLFSILLEKLEGIHKLRSTEWAGLGGDTLNLTPDEIAVARGAQ